MGYTKMMSGILKLYNLLQEREQAMPPKSQKPSLNVSSKPLPTKATLSAISLAAVVQRQQ